MQADAASFLLALQKRVGQLTFDAEWLPKLKKKDSDKDAANR